ncbi:MAG TPA: metal ABC transporter permease [Nitrososphaeraceae archaeon]|jgi:manganese/iron transport system permease protein/iron/zinc/copper transport system permease protein
MDFLTPFQYEFFTRGVIAAILVGGTCGLIGVYIVLRGMSYIGHGMSHAVFGGAVVSYVIGFNYYVGAAIWGFLSAVLINEISRRRKIKADAAIGVVTTAGFAIGVLFITAAQSFHRNFEAILFGNILGITDQDLYVIILVSIFTAIFVFFFQKRLLFVLFDKETATVYGVRTEILEIVFALVLALVVIASMNSIGVTLLAAAIVAPAISARMLTNNFLRMIIFSSLIGIATAFLGMYSSFFFDTASGSTIVLFGAGAFGISSLYAFIRKTYHSHSHGPVKHTHPHLHTDQHLHKH